MVAGSNPAVGANPYGLMAMTTVSKTASAGSIPATDASTCPYCNRIMGHQRWHGRRPTRDHIMPKSRGGPNSPANIIMVCNVCNCDKSDMTIGEFFGWLIERNDFRAPIIETLAVAAINGDPDLADQIAVDVQNGKVRARREIDAMRGSLKRKIGFELVH